MQWQVWLVCTCSVCVCVGVVAERTPVVETVQGKLRGRVVHSYTSKRILSFIGVRFAEPPVGKNRFKTDRRCPFCQTLLSTFRDSRGSVLPWRFRCVGLPGAPGCRRTFQPTQGTFLFNVRLRDLCADKLIKAPIPVKPWQGVKDAVEDGPLCPQPVAPNITVSEDCLFLSVHTKTLRGKQPVIIHLHSGGFVSGTGNNLYCGPQYFLDQDIVLVTLNYRLGPLGFLSTGDSVLPGNYGLKDQLLVMRWVKQNIAQFGGDPGSVTLYGYSAGAGSVHLHMLSPLSAGLFHKVIVSSCSATTPCTLNRDPASLARRFAKIVNCPNNSSEQIRDCLLRLPEPSLTEVYTNDKIWDTLQPPFYVFSPVVEREGGDERFLMDDPVKIIESGHFTQVPMIIGITRDEFDWRAEYVLQNQTYLSRLNKEFDEIAPWEFHYPRQPRNLSLHISSACRHFYLQDQPVSNRTEKQLGELYADSMIIFSVYQAAKLFAEKSSAPLYFYLFTFEGRYSYRYKIGTDTPYGVGHHDDMIYLFYQAPRFPLFNRTDPEVFMVRTLSSVYTNFAAFGTPKLPDSMPEWLPMTSQHLQYLEISDKPRMRPGLPYQERMTLWENLLPLSQPYRQILY